MKAISINYILLIEKSRRLVRFLPFYKFFSAWRDREKRKFYELYKQGKFSKAISFGEAALQKKRNDYDLHLRKSVVFTYRNLGRHDLADSKLREGLSTLSQKSSDIIIDQIQKELIKTLGDLKVESKIIDLGGLENFCQVHQETIDLNSQKKYYITKISKPKKLKIEHHFYNQICERNPKLKSITPGFIGYFETENSKLAFLTLDKISGIEVKLEHIQSVIEAHKILSSFRFDLANGEFNHSLNKISIMLNFKYKYIPSKVFSIIHRQDTNTLMIKWIRKRLSIREGAMTNKTLVDELELIVLKRRFYEKIVPSKHFSFVHGDFAPQNLLMDEQSGKIYILDWTGYFFGPAKFDMVCFLQSFPLNFKDIKQKYIDKIINEDCKDSIIEVSLFVYLLIISWLRESNIDRVLKKNSSYLTPAINYLEYLTNKLG